MSRQGKEHARGPYKHGQRYRIVFVGATGAEQTESFEDEAEAIQERDAYNAKAGSRTVGEALAEYLKENEGAKGIATTRYRLYGILRVADGDRPLYAITEAVARKLYEQRTKEVAVDTHQGELRYAKRFFVRCVERGWLRISPMANVKETGERNKGKPRLRVNGTRQYLATLLADESLEATAVLTALTLSLRASAVVGRTVADLDDDGRLLWVRNNKSKAGDLEIEVPEFLRQRLLKIAEGKPLTARLFGDMSRHALHYHTVKYCKVAGVDRVTPHGLRGSGATTAVRAGAAIEQVAKQIGHADKGVTLKAHYLSGGAIESGNARRIESLVLDQDLSHTSVDNQEVN